MKLVYKGKYTSEADLPVRAHPAGSVPFRELEDMKKLGLILNLIVGFGLAVLFLYWKTRNIWACGIIHGIYDFLLSIRDCFFNVPIDKMSYVLSGEGGKTAAIVYAVITLIELFLFWIIYRKIGKKIDYQKIREEW